MQNLTEDPHEDQHRFDANPDPGPDLDRYQHGNSDPDSDTDPDRYQYDADPQHWFIAHLTRSVSDR